MDYSILKTYTELFADCGVSVECVLQIKSFKHVLNYYKLKNSKEWMKLKHAIKSVCDYCGGTVYDGKPRRESDFILMFPLPVTEWSTKKFESYGREFLEKASYGDFQIGWTIDGEELNLNITDTRSILVAGSSGGGKSSLMNCIISSLIATTPNIIVDFIDLRKVEFSFYNYFKETQYKVSTTKSEATALLRIVKDEIDTRYAEMEADGVLKAPLDKYPIHVIFIDEFATLDAPSGTEINSLVSYITAVGRVCNVYMVIATQHPKNSVIDNAIRANCSTKFVLACANAAQSTTICGQKIGVELLGKGDGYAVIDDRIKPVRFQSPLYDEQTRQKLYKLV